MRNTFLIGWRELSGYFASPIAYVFLMAFLLVSSANLIFIGDFFEIGQASMRLFFGALPWIFLILIPAITMRLWSEELREGTIELLMTLPMRASEVMLGKFLAAWAFIGIALAMTLPIPILISTISDLDWWPVMGGYAGAMMLGGAYLAIGMCVSAMSRNQILSFILAAAICVGFLTIGYSGLLKSAPWLAVPGRAFGFLPHFENVQRGVLDSRNLVYFGSLIFFFLMLNRYLIGGYRYA